MSNNNFFKNKTVLITGGTGSFGSSFVKYLLKNSKTKKIIVFSRDELKQSKMEAELKVGAELKNNRLRFFIGDVRDLQRLQRAFNGVDIVVHAAALKQIPHIEYNPKEAIATNIMGTANIIDAAIDNNVKKIILISSDKAVNPVNLYGATKLCAEKLFIQANSYTGEKEGEKEIKFSCVRYGNVIGSRGSVAPIFLKQKEKGLLTLTNKEMTRFWITLSQGVKFVIHSINRMKGGEIFVPKIPSMKIIDLAKIIAPKAKIKIIGIRPGEKLHEVLLSPEEAMRSEEFDGCFLIKPEFPFWKETYPKNGKPVPNDFRYSSDTNKEWLTEKEMKKILKTLKIEK